MMTDQDLDHCRCCGSQATFSEVIDGEDPNFGGHFIICENPDCGITTGIRFAQAHEDPRVKLAEIWNRRAGEADMEARKDAAYLERNQVVAALARCFPSGVARTAIEGWSDDWHGCVYVDLPTGQASWHFHDSHAHLFAALPPYAKPWDGHDTPEKYRRLASIAGPGATPVPLNEETRNILGRPNFACAAIAEALRKIGHVIKHRSEDEQAAVIHWMLNLYLVHGDAWPEEAGRILKSGLDRAAP
jgi:hypothetical protein